MSKVRECDLRWTITETSLIFYNVRKGYIANIGLHRCDKEEKNDDNRSSKR